jgi:hypothetical protein
VSTDDVKRAVLNRAEEFPAPAPPTLPRKKKKKIVPKKVRAAVELLAKPKIPVAVAARHVGLTRQYLDKMLGMPHVEEYYEKKKRRNVAVAGIRAAAKIGELVDSDSAKVALEASKFALGVTGIKVASDTQVNVSLSVQAGWVIDLSNSRDRAQPRDVVAVELPAPAEKQGD